MVVVSLFDESVDLLVSLFDGSVVVVSLFDESSLWCRCLGGLWWCR
jgi:hypothetical protein